MLFFFFFCKIFFLRNFIVLQWWLRFKQSARIRLIRCCTWTKKLRVWFYQPFLWLAPSRSVRIRIHVHIVIDISPAFHILVARLLRNRWKLLSEGSILRSANGADKKDFAKTPRHYWKGIDVVRIPSWKYEEKLANDS